MGGKRLSFAAAHPFSAVATIGNAGEFARGSECEACVRGVVARRGARTFRCAQPFCCRTASDAAHTKQEEGHPEIAVWASKRARVSTVTLNGDRRGGPRLKMRMRDAACDAHCGPAVIQSAASNIFCRPAALRSGGVGSGARSARRAPERRKSAAYPAQFHRRAPEGGTIATGTLSVAAA